MSVADSGSMIDSIRSARVLDDSQMGAAEQLVRRQSWPAAAEELVNRGWLTAWQLQMIEKKDGPQLVVGSYVLLDLLGQGGMGAVYRARHRRLKRLAALKLINPELLTHEDVVLRFHREAEAVARLDHPNIVRVYDAAEADGHHFLAMEFVEGIDLGRLIRERKVLPVAEACEYVRQAALGLQHAHEQGLVHRDIKPGNLLLATASGTVKILDLGLARLDRRAAADEQTPTLTNANTPIGTPAYWAPEQALNPHEADIRADIYSLGCTLYHLLAGRPPFVAGEFGQYIAMHLAVEPDPVETHRPDVPAEVSAVVRAMMAKKPQDRLQTPLQVAMALEPWSAPLPKPAAPSAVPQLPSTLPAPASKPAPGVHDTAAPRATVANAWRRPPQSRPGPRRLIGLLLVAGIGAIVVVAAIVLPPWLGTDPPPATGPAVANATTANASGTGDATHKTGAPPTTAARPGDLKPPVPTKPISSKPPTNAKPPTQPVTGATTNINSRDVDLGNGVKLKLVRIPKGKFWVGGGGGKPGKKQAEVADFYLGAYEVTQAQWKAVMGADNNPSGFPGDDLPVENVSWTEVNAFVEKLNQKRSGGGFVFRLPTEAEWEYACRGGATSEDECAFDFYLDKPTNDLSSDDANFDGTRPAGGAAKSKSLTKTAKVGSYRPNKLGLHDMHGNVWEWCDDTVQEEGDSFRVLRGGGWNHYGSFCRAGYRFWLTRERHSWDAGFRLAATAAAKQ